MRENRLHGSEGGEGESPFRPLSSRIIGTREGCIWVSSKHQCATSVSEHRRKEAFEDSGVILIGASGRRDDRSRISQAICRYEQAFLQGEIRLAAVNRHILSLLSVLVYTVF